MLSFLSHLRGRPRYGVAFEEAFLLAARCNTVDGEPETVRTDLPPGLVSASPVDLNVGSVAKLAQLTEEALKRLGLGRGPGVLVLPDLALRGFILPSGTRRREEITAALGPRLPFPVGEAQIDVWRDDGGRGLAAVIRRPVLRQYESVLEAIDCQPVWVDGASLVSIPGWARATRVGRGPHTTVSIQAQLFTRHFTLSVFRDGEILDFRTKLRSPGDLARVAEDFSRLQSIYGEDGSYALTLWGEDVAELVEHIESKGSGFRQLAIGQEGEEAHLRGVVANVVARLS